MVIGSKRLGDNRLADTLIPSPQDPPEVLSESAKTFAAAASSENTKRAYSADWAAFTTWCGHAGRSPLPAEPGTMADYLAGMADAGYKASSINRRAAAIARAHRLAGLETPLRGVAKETMAGIRRTLGVAPTTQATPVTLAILRSSAPSRKRRQGRSTAACHLDRAPFPGTLEQFGTYGLLV